jgi:F-type H+-transporting ATPase subunit a
MFVKLLVDNLGVVGGVMSVVPIGAAIGIYFLEVLVAFIQAFVFTFLTTLFLGQLIVHEGHDHAEQGHDRDGHRLDDPLREPTIGDSTDPAAKPAL